MPYCCLGSSIKYQGHTGWKIDDLNPVWVRLLGRSQLSNPSDLPCYFLKWTYKVVVNFKKFNIIEKIPFMVYLEIQCITFKIGKIFYRPPLDPAVRCWPWGIFSSWLVSRDLRYSALQLLGESGACDFDSRHLARNLLDRRVARIVPMAPDFKWVIMPYW